MKKFRVIVLMHDYMVPPEDVTGHDLIVDGGSGLPSHQSDELLRALLARWDR